MAVPPSARIKCVVEDEALRDFFEYLEARGPNVILVGVDEDTVGVVLDKLKAMDRKRCKASVVGYSWWRRVLKHLSVANYNTTELEDYHHSTSPSSTSGGLHTAAAVANILASAVGKVTHEYTAENIGELVVKVGVSGAFRPKQRARQTEVRGQETLEIYSSFRPDLATYITAERTEQVG